PARRTRDSVRGRVPAAAHDRTGTVAHLARRRLHRSRRAAQHVRAYRRERAIWDARRPLSSPRPSIDSAYRLTRHEAGRRATAPSPAENSAPTRTEIARKT